MVAISTLLLSAALHASGDAPSVPLWLWGQAERAAGQSCCLRGEVAVGEALVRARLFAVADYCHAAAFVNAAEIARREPYGPPVRADVTGRLRPGNNTICLVCRSVAGPAAAMLRLELEYEDGRRQTVVADESWRAASLPGAELELPAADGLEWRPASSFGTVEKHPWGEPADTISIRPADNYEQWKQAIGAAAGTDPQTFQALPGFEVRLLRSAAENEDSWVSLACDPQGRWIIAKEKRGLLRVTLSPAADAVVRVETIDDSLAECRGLLFAYDSLYAMANNDHALYRLRDADGDGRFEATTKLAEFEGGVGHGRNQIALGPDGWLYGIFGDSVREPAAARALPPPLADPTRHERAPNGFVARTDRDGQRWEVVTRGLRNPFGIDFHPHGEMFTYDADAEFDMGASWYRPTRIDHLLPGGDFGWRAVTGQWPPYFADRPDMPPPTLDIGKGSPTAVAFGTKSHFPHPYRQALFVLDWSYGRIVAVHLAPRGSSYAAHAETFLRGRPLNVTDVKFGPDGAMYFVTGGRGTRSALYRVAYTGPAVSEPPPNVQQTARERHAEEARRVRRELESFLGRHDARALDAAWPRLSDSDPWIRHAARAAIEWQPAPLWRARALRETQTDAALAALMALARIGAAEDRAAIVERLLRFDLRSFTERQKLEAAFLIDRSLPDDAALASAHGAAAAQQLAALYPDPSPRVNMPLSLLLSRWETPDFVPKTVKLLEQSEDPTQRFHFLFVLRNAKQGWLPELRERYFDQLARMSEFVGGEGMPTFRRSIETEALNAAPSDERAHYAKRLLSSYLPPLGADLAGEPRPFVRKWSLNDFAEPGSDLDQGRDVARGKRLFAEARCLACHRAGGVGGVSGPDLTSVARRFSPRDILTSILEPSRVIAENYQSDAFTLRDGRVLVGRVVPGDYRSPELRLLPDLLSPEKIVTFSKSEIESHQPSPVSPMPSGLADTLTRDEILDLVAYLASLADE